MGTVTRIVGGDPKARNRLMVKVENDERVLIVPLEFIEKISYVKETSTLYIESNRPGRGIEKEVLAGIADPKQVVVEEWGA